MIHRCHIYKKKRLSSISERLISINFELSIKFYQLILKNKLIIINYL